MLQKVTLWLDCDPGLDDTFALIYAAHDESVNLLGVSTSPGNTTLSNTTRNALDVLYNIGRSEIPVFTGSNLLIKGELKLAEHMHGSNGLGGVQLPKSPVEAVRENAFEKIYERIMGHEGKITWANTGSLTNLCLLLLVHPQLREKIGQIVLMGGALGKGNITPAAEFNVFFDPNAYDQVLHLKGDIPLVMIPLEVTHENMATQDVFERLEKSVEIPFAKALLNMLEQYKSMYFNAYKFPFPPIHDPCVIHYILHPEEFEAKPVPHFLRRPSSKWTPTRAPTAGPTASSVTPTTPKKSSRAVTWWRCT